MSAQSLITEHLDLWTGAVTKKASSGRGSNGKVELTGVKKLRELILELAVRGFLTDQLPTDESADRLLEKIIPEVKQLINDGRFKVPKEAKSNSEVEAPFKIPQTWNWCSLDQIAVIARGGSPRPIKAYTTTSPNGLNWIKIGDAKKGSRLITNAAEKIIPEGLHKTRMVYPGDLILSNSMSFGQPYILDIEGCIHDGWLLLRTPEGLLDKVFLYYLLLSPYAMNAFTDSAAGAVVQNLNADKVRVLQVPLPPVEEQHRIVQKVDKLMVLCDRMEQQTSDQLEAHETLVDTLLGTLTQSENASELADNWARLAAYFDTLFTTEQSIDKLKQATLELAVRGKLVDQNPEDKPAQQFLELCLNAKSIVAQQGKLKKARKHVPITDDYVPFKLPKGWLWARLDDLVRVINGRAYKKHEMLSSGTPLLRVGNLFTSNEWYYSDLELEDEKYIDDGDLIYAWSASFGPFIWEGGRAIYHYHIWKLDLFDAQAISKHFLYLYLRTITEEIKSSGSGIAMIHMTKSKMEELVFPFPPLEEQHRIVQKVDELMALCDQLKECLNQASETRNQMAEAVVRGALN